MYDWNRFHRVVCARWCQERPIRNADISVAKSSFLPVTFRGIIFVKRRESWMNMDCTISRHPV